MPPSSTERGDDHGCTRRTRRDHHRRGPRPRAASTRCCSRAKARKVVVNDLGGDMHGDGGDPSAAMQVVDEIKAMGGEAVVNGDNVADWDGAQRLVQQAIDTFGDLHVLVNNAGILRDRVIINMTEAEWDAVITVHLKGHFCPTRHAAVYWREQTKAGKDVQRVDRPHDVDVGPVLESRAGQLRRGQERYRHALADLREGARRATACARTRSRPAARTRLTEATPGLGDVGEGARRRLRRVGPGQRVAVRRVPRHRRLPVHRRDASSCRAARCSARSRGRPRRRSTRTTAGRSRSWRRRRREARARRPRSSSRTAAACPICPGISDAVNGVAPTHDPSDPVVGNRSGLLSSEIHSPMPAYERSGTAAIEQGCVTSGAGCLHGVDDMPAARRVRGTA